MMNARDVLRRKANPSVITIEPGASVLEAARQMNAHRIGALVVVRPGALGDQVAGMFTERDVLTRVVAQQRDPAATVVGDVMTSPALVCEPGTALDDLRSLMRERRIRHVPVVERGVVVGMVSLGDLNAAVYEATVQSLTVLEEFISRS